MNIESAAQPKNQSAEEMAKIEAFYKGKSALVTGGFGFVGSHMTKALVNLGVEVTVIDRRTDPSIPSLLNSSETDLRKKIKIVNGDLADRCLIEELFQAESFDFVFNFASFATVIEKAVDSPYETIQANTVGVVNLLEAIRKFELKQTRFFHASTDKVYGEMDGEPYEEERTPLRGIGLYDSSKLAADLFVRTYHEVYGLPTAVLRMCNIFGPADYNTNYRLIPRALRNIYASQHPKSPELYFDSIEHWRDYLYIDDCIRAILLIVSTEECQGEVFNLAACQFIATPELLRKLVHIAYEVEQKFDAERAEEILNGGIAIKVRENGPGVLIISKQRLNGNKIRELAQFEPLISFQEGLERTVRAYREHYLNAKSGKQRNQEMPETATTYTPASQTAL